MNKKIRYFTLIDINYLVLNFNPRNKIYEIYSLKIHRDSIEIKIVL